MQPGGTAPRRVVVTGGATNIGRAITTAFVAAGARVAVGQPDPAVAASLVRESGGRVFARPVDVGDGARCREFIDTAADRLGGLDVLVNNAAITGEGARWLPEIDPAYAERMWRVNVGGVLFCAQAAVAHLRRAGGGAIVNLSSTNALRPQNGAMVYAATKAAVASVTRSLARELAADGIRVVAVAPGDIVTDRTAPLVAGAGPGGVHADVLGRTPLGRGRPADVAATVLHLCSDGARFVTGCTWLVDGGLSA